MIGSLLASCENGRRDIDIDGVHVEKSYDFSQPIDTISSSEINQIRYLPLRGSEDHNLSDITKLCVQDSIYVMGNRYDDKLICFSDKGEFLYEIASQGEGPEEYIEIASFTTTKSAIYIMDNHAHKMIKYSLRDGKFISKSDIKFVAWDFEAFDDDAFLFTCMPVSPGGEVNMKAGDYAVWRTNGKWEIEDFYIPFKPEYCEPFGKRRWFTRNMDEIQIAFLNYDGFFTFTKSGDVNFTPLLFSHTWPRKNGVVTEDPDDENVEYLSETPFVSTRWGLLEITMGLYDYTYIIDRRNDNIFCNSRTSAKCFMYKIKGVKDNTFIGVINDNYDNYLELVEYGFPKADKETEALLAQGGMCLLMYEMK